MKYESPNIGTDKIAKPRISYKKSRCVKICYQIIDKCVKGRTKPRNFKHNSRRTQQFGRNRIKIPSKCPGAPHNTTSFIINYHSRNSSDKNRRFLTDSVRFENIFFPAKYLENDNKYEVSSVIE